MAVEQLKASDIKYGKPARISIGAYWLTITCIEFPTEKEFTEKGGVELDYKKLGLRKVLGFIPSGIAPKLGSVAATSGVPVAAWCTPIFSAKEAFKGGEETAKNVPAFIVNEAGKLFLKILLPKETNKTNESFTEQPKVRVDLCQVNVFAIGK